MDYDTVIQQIMEIHVYFLIRMCNLSLQMDELLIEMDEGNHTPEVSMEFRRLLGEYNTLKERYAAYCRFLVQQLEDAMVWRVQLHDRFNI